MLLCAYLLEQYFDIEHAATAAWVRLRAETIGAPTGAPPTVRDNSTAPRYLPTGVADHAAIAAALLGCFPEATLFATDTQYTLPRAVDVDAFLAQDDTDQFSYVVEKHDCDDSAAILYGNERAFEYTLHTNRSWAFGMAFGTAKHDATRHHAFVAVLDEQRLWWAVEPQTDERVALLDFAYTVDTLFL